MLVSQQESRLQLMGSKLVLDVHDRLRKVMDVPVSKAPSSRKEK